MGQSANLITTDQRVVDQLAVENLNGLRIKKELAIQKKVRHDKELVRDYLSKKFSYISNLDDSVINGMAKDEFDRILKKASIRYFSVIGLRIIWILSSPLCLITIIMWAPLSEILSLVPGFSFVFSIASICKLYAKRCEIKNRPAIEIK